MTPHDDIDEPNSATFSEFPKRKFEVIAAIAIGVLILASPLLNSKVEDRSQFCSASPMTLDAYRRCFGLK